MTKDQIKHMQAQMAYERQRQADGVSVYSNGKVRPIIGYDRDVSNAGYVNWDSRTPSFFLSEITTEHQ